MPWLKKEKPVEVNQEILPQIRVSEVTKQKQQLIVGQLVNKLLTGLRRSELIQFCMVQFGISATMAQDFIDAAFDVMKDDVLVETKFEATMAITRRMDLYHQAYQAGDWRTCLEIIKDLNKLRGLYAKDSADRAVDALEKLITSLDNAPFEMEIDSDNLTDVPETLDAVFNDETDLDDGVDEN